MKASELREMSDDQLEDTLKVTCEGYFRLRMQAQTERLDAPSELRRSRRLIARIKTVQRERTGDSTSAVKRSPSGPGVRTAPTVASNGASACRSCAPTT